jgi:SpoVK/Ycf46/Vps4 family AAA+-type ATPase
MLAALRAGWLVGPAVAGHLRQEKRRVALGAEALRWVEPDVTWRDVGGLGALRAWLERRKPALSPQARDFGLPYPKGVLLAGVQGCGKSLCAKALADLWGLPLARLDLGLLFRPGSSPELEMYRALAAVEGLAPAALWVDELDKVWSGPGGGASDTVSRALGLLITWLQERTSEVPLVATANNVHGLPPELVRKGRFDEIFFVDLPTEAERRQILSIHLRQRGRDPHNFDVQAVASRTEHFSGAELERIVVEGLHEAFADGRELSTGDLLLAAAETVPLAVTFEEPVRALRDWARGRARSASGDSSLLELFRA